MELEICVESVASAIASERGGAQRVELCSALSEGGLTPSAAMLRAVRSSVAIGVHVMIRPRSGDFFYSDDEYAVMEEDIEYVRYCGVTGVVFGLLTAGGDVDVQRTRALVKLSRPMEVTFHRAIDMSRDVEAALEDVIATGADRILTSGAEANALLGSENLRRLALLSKGRIRVMAGGGIRAHNVGQLAKSTGITEFHAALRTVVESPVTFRRNSVQMGEPGRDEYARFEVSEDDVRTLRIAIDNAASLYSPIDEEG